jgi:hypothetical protein
MKARGWRSSSKTREKGKLDKKGAKWIKGEMGKRKKEESYLDFSLFAF